MIVKAGISDIHFKADSPPLVRTLGSLSHTKYAPLSAEAVKNLALAMMTPEQKSIFDREHELDMAYSLSGVGHFRANIYMQKGTVAVTLRVVPLQVKSFEDLNLPGELLSKLASEPRGLVLIAGMTGSGKTTTMNAMVNWINQNSNLQIISIEDPIEFYHADQKSSIVQREIGSDTQSFKNALRFVLRQDPDVIVVGEMRDYTEIAAAIEAAETGHLVISTIHTLDAVSTLDRIVSFYPPHQEAYVRNQISGVLKGIVAQRLMPSLDGASMMPATEILIGTAVTKKLITEWKPHDIYRAMEQGEYYKMHTFEQDLLRLVQQKKIAFKEALDNATNPDDFILKARVQGEG
jgi:twitching motility protein PilT